MANLVLDKAQLSKISNSTVVKTPTNARYIKETEANNEALKQKMQEYTEAHKNAANFYVK